MAYNMREYRRNGMDNGIVENMGEAHLPAVILADTSSSMAGAVNDLNDGIRELVESIKDDPKASGQVELCVIAFDDEARIKMPFGPIYDVEAPCFHCSGTTAMHKAVDMALNEIEARKNQYKMYNTSYYRPWIFLLTDGGANDRDNGAFERLRMAQENKGCIFFPCAIGNSVDMSLLKSFRPDGLVLKASRENFKKSFEWLSNSLPAITRSRPGEHLALPNPRDFQLDIEA